MDYQGSYESTAKAELDVARRLAEQGDYWTAVYHCQQSAEKMIDEKMITPMERYGKRQADEAISQAEFVLKALQKLLDEPAQPKSKS